MSERIELDPGWPWAKKYRITPGIRIGDTVYTSGQVALDADGNLVGGDDVGAQSRRVFENVRAVLAEAGATMDDVVKITTFLTDVSRFAEFAAARAEAFPNRIPASPVIGTPALVQPALLVEVEAIAVIGSGARR